MVRQPFVADRFYPGSPEKLRALLQSKVPTTVSVRPEALGALVHHAGYVYSGGVAGEVYARLEVPSTVLLLGTNHTGMGSPFSLSQASAWRTPLGECPVNRTLQDRLLLYVPYLREDEEAHREEHSLEVQLPFLQYRNRSLSLVALVVGSYDQRELLLVGQGIGKILREEGERVALIVSTDFSHYVPQGEAVSKDRAALEAIENLDAEGLWRVVKEMHTTMCGLSPVVTALAALKEMGATKGETVLYQTSGEITGDYTGVVGYGGVLFV